MTQHPRRPTAILIFPCPNFVELNMNAVELIRAQLETSMGITMPLIQDLRDQPLTQPSEKGGNHALWIIGHLAYAEGNLLRNWMLGEANPVDDWGSLFAGGTTPSTNASDYPPFDDLLEKFQELRAGTIEFVSTLADTDLDAASKVCPPEFADFFGTVGKCLSNTALHWMGHRGQLADIR